MAIGCFVSVGRTLQDAVARVELAEELGYEAAYVTHIAARDSLTVLAAYAARPRASAWGPAWCRSTRARRRPWR